MLLNALITCTHSLVCVTILSVIPGVPVCQLQLLTCAAIQTKCKGTGVQMSIHIRNALFPVPQVVPITFTSHLPFYEVIAQTHRGLFLLEVLLCTDELMAKQ